MVDQGRTQTILLFSVGPVQSFIATARRTQDLFVSSAILSDLARVGIATAEKQGAELIFPRRVDGQLPDSVPNRFAVLVESDAIDDVAQAVENSVRQRWAHICGQTLGLFQQLAPKEGWSKAWQRQVDSWLEFYWAGWTWNPQAESYNDAFNNAGLALDARKRLRQFPKWPEPGEKCSLSGTHEALSDNSMHLPTVRTFWEKIRQRSEITPAELRPGERLSAISTVKRLALNSRVNLDGFDRIRFPSTSSVAAASFLTDLFAVKQDGTHEWPPDLKAAVESFINAMHLLRVTEFNTTDAIPHLATLAQGNEQAMQLLRYDGDFFYPETYTQERLEETLKDKPIDKDRRKALTALNELRQVAVKHGVRVPHLYYAVLYLDGDRMGRLVSGCDREQHRHLSEALSRFAQHVAPQIVKHDYPGALVYSGGDDVLALTPLAFALPLADALRRAFRQTLHEADFSETTVSVGMAIAHHIQPLDFALNGARDAERTAKAYDERNRLVINVLRRSGERQQVQLPWRNEDVKVDPTTGVVVERGEPVDAALQPIEAVRLLMTSGRLSGKVAFDVTEEAVALENVTAALELELLRLLKRHADNAKQMEPELTQVARGLAGLVHNEQLAVIELAYWLQLARFLAQGGRE